MSRGSHLEKEPETCEKAPEGTTNRSPHSASLLYPGSESSCRTNGTELNWRTREPTDGCVHMFHYDVDVGWAFHVLKA